MFGDSGIRVASIIIGILFIIGLVVLANRFGGQIKQRLQTRVATTTITPSPSPKTFGQIVGQTKGQTTPEVSQIPGTGAETVVIPVLISLLGIGLKLRKSA